MKFIGYQSNPHNILFILHSSKGSPKTERDIKYIANGKPPSLIRSGLDALCRRGLVTTTSVPRTSNGKECLLEAYVVTQRGVEDIQRLSRLTPGRSSYTTNRKKVDK
jgi:hypothetical protein